MENNIGQRIAARRKQLGMSQTDLGRQLAVTAQAVSRWENGHNMPDSGLYTRLANTLRITVEELMTGKSSLETDWNLTGMLHSIEDMEQFLLDTAERYGLEQTKIVLPLVKKWHEGQWWKETGERVPFISHPFTVACQAISLGFAEDDLVATALLHEVPGSCGIPVEHLPVSEEVRHTVNLLTFRPVAGETWEQARVRHCGALRDNRNACIVKVIARTHFVSTMASRFTREQTVEYVRDSDTYILPLTEHLRTAWPECTHASQILRYHIVSVTETIKWLL